LLLVKKTDSAEWLEILLPWSWNPLPEWVPSLHRGKRQFAPG